PSRVPSVEPSATPPASPKPTPKPKPQKGEQPSARPTAPSESEEAFEFFGLPMSLPQIDFNIAYRLSTTADYASQWKDLDRSGAAKRLVPAIKSAAGRIGLNDYLTYEFLKAYIDSKFPQADPSSKLSAIHYFLANLGYDARIAMTGTGTPLLLLPFKQTIYARNYLIMTDGKYYVFAPDGFDYTRLGKEGVRTCTLPKDADKGKKFDLVLGELNIPVSPKKFELAYGPLTLTGEVNENLMPILYHYPQMPISDYAVSAPDPALRRLLTEQVKSQLGSFNGDEKVEQLLGFMHNAFEYATDEEFHGFEKPYFLEETLFYPKNDCEDRAIFYTYFLWNALGREAQLISFPGHEAATVKLENPVDGTGYKYGGNTFFISDPTFIGSHTGMVMPIYRNENPKVDYTFSKSANND
ncbi:MAG: hypothetical protein K2G23_07330, partial [Muribaculaceae bacterium]|nr:hypothetical protein [Muribaculaceae bacterium]